MDIEELKSKLWVTAKQFGNNLDFDVHRHMVLGLIFLKYITDTHSDKSEEELAKNVKGSGAKSAENLQDYFVYNEFFVPKNAQWNFLQKNARQSNIGILLDNAIGAIEKLNKELENILPSGYSDSTVDKLILGELVSLIGDISVGRPGHKKKLLAEVYEYLIVMFADFGCKSKGRFYAPQSILKLLVQLTAPHQGRVYDGCCDTGQLFVQSEKFLKKRSKTNTLSFFGQESNHLTLKIAKMNLRLNDIEANLQEGDVFINDAYPDLAADYILASPPFSADIKKEWLQDDKRWKYGVPPKENVKYGWLQHFIYKLSPMGIAGIVLTEDSSKRNIKEDTQIRKNLIEDKVIDSIIALPSKLFCHTGEPAFLWIVARNKTNNTYREADNEILFIDARKLAVIGKKKNKELSDEDILLISRTYQRWKNINGDYTDIKDFCKATTLEEVRKNTYSLLPQTYIQSRVNARSLSILLLIVLAGFFYFITSRNGLETSTSKVQDTRVAVKPSNEIESSQPSKKTNKTVKKVVVSDHLKVKKDTVVVSSVSSKIIRDTGKVLLPHRKEVQGGTKYKVISTAYFYNKPDEHTQRRAFITHWNNSYANIQGLDEKNGFIYVVFTNHLHQTSKGWLRKKDLREAER